MFICPQREWQEISACEILDVSAIRVLMVEDDARYRTFVRDLLLKRGHPRFDFVGVDSIAECKKYLSEEMTDVVLLDLNLSDSAGMSTISAVAEMRSSAPIISGSFGVLAPDLQKVIETLKISNNEQLQWCRSYLSYTNTRTTHRM